MQPSEQPTVTHKWNLTKVIKTPNTRRTAALQNSIKLKLHNFYKAGGIGMVNMFLILMEPNSTEWRGGMKRSKYRGRCALLGE